MLDEDKTFSGSLILMKSSVHTLTDVQVVQCGIEHAGSPSVASH